MFAGGTVVVVVAGGAVVVVCGAVPPGLVDEEDGGVVGGVVLPRCTENVALFEAFGLTDGGTTLNEVSFVRYTTTVLDRLGSVLLVAVTNA